MEKVKLEYWAKRRENIYLDFDNLHKCTIIVNTENQQKQNLVFWVCFLPMKKEKTTTNFPYFLII